MKEPETRIIHLELLHALAAVQRARLIAQGSELETDLAQLLETMHELLKELNDDARCL